MAKYSYELKKKVVTSYLSGEGAYSLAKKYEITHKTSIDNWVKSYQAEGDNGLLRSRQNKAYS
ncbi:helix-turn-helix domain-containing protein, partial [Anaerosporobacter faecicola]|uniref:helix-turn-helix domain-containing protein n=1 Tax=Anaerosporobacter faecicola TaxID=2718714 RepID=UPI00143BD858